MNGIRLTKCSKRGLVNIIDTTYKYLFGTLDKEELELKIHNLSENSVQTNELNEVIK